MILYGTYFSPFARRVGVALLSRDMPFNHVPLNGFAEPETASSLNPVGRVPVLELADGNRVAESWAIFDFLDASLHDGEKLLPVSAEDRIDDLQAAGYASTVYDIIGLLGLIEGLDVADPPARLARLREQLEGGIAALDRFAERAIVTRLPTIGVISAVVAFAYLERVRPDHGAAPQLAGLARKWLDTAPFAATDPWKDDQ